MGLSPVAKASKGRFPIFLAKGLEKEVTMSDVIRLSPEALKIAKELSVERKESLGETIGRALGALKVITQEQTKGAQVFVERKDGSVKKLK
jgi:hypothetical protein